MSPSENVPPSEFNSPLLPTLGPHCRTSGSGRDGRSNRRNWEADPAVQGNVNLTLQSTSSPSLAWTGTALRWTTMVTSFTTRTCAPWWVDQPLFFHSSSGLLLLVSLSMSTTMYSCTLFRGDHQLFACDTKLCHVIYRPRFAHCRFCTKCHLWLFSRECALSKGVVKIKTVILRSGWP